MQNRQAGERFRRGGNPPGGSLCQSRCEPCCFFGIIAAGKLQGRASPLCQMNSKRLSLSVLLLAALAGCGGGTRGSADTGLSQLTRDHANLCAIENPRARDSAGNLLAGYRAGSRQDEQQFVRQYLNDKYLWYREMPAVDGSLFSLRPDYDEGMKRYFQALLTPAKTASGRNKDRFSFALSTAEWQASSVAGVVQGYGVEFAVIRNEAPRQVRVAYVLAGSPAAKAGLKRGDTLMTVQTAGKPSIDVVNTTDQNELAEVNRALFEPGSGERVSFQFARTGAPTQAVQLAAGEQQAQPVQLHDVLTNDRGDRVGYLAFNRFILPLEKPLIDAVRELQKQQVSEVVVDLRYNGGGYLYQSAQLAYMLADPNLTRNKVFERLQYSDKRAADTNSHDSLLRFQSITSGTSGTNTRAGEALPNLGLRRVYVLTGADTCSASESLINGLRGVDVEVIQIGNTTCGKPYGFRAHDNCGMSYFPIEFVGVNDKNVGGFDDGFVPNCPAVDDFAHELGDRNESLLAAALRHQVTGQCQGVSTKGNIAGASTPQASAPLLRRGPMFTNKFLLP